ncbi:MAG TPA: arginine--tRNA ligase, partial [Candidatus Aenigmarchaeota archaeon]|nr:arginine--tRNA ligase [Candidatus Aenigmarchaeota archaeon]
MSLIKKTIKEEVKLETPPHEDFGDLATNVCFQIAKKLKKHPQQVAEEIVKKMKIPKDSLIKRVEAKAGYINFFFDWDKIAGIVLKDVLSLKENYGKPVVKKKRIMVEHTSVNPNKAIHIGHARNACLGDFLARILRWCNNEVIVANYIDDTGNQVADIVVGFKFLDFPEEKKGVKFDHYCGDEVYVKVNKMYKEKPELLEKRRLVMKKIEEGNNEIAKYAKAVAEKVLIHQLKTLWRLGIFYDLLNWESDILHTNLWNIAFRLLKKQGYVYYARRGRNKGCWLLKLSHLPEFKGLENPDKILVRSDGTVVYAGKDIAYAMWKHGLLEDVFNYKRFVKQPNGKDLWETTSEGGEKNYPKFNNVDVSINVIDVRQSYEQSVVATALKMIGHGKKKYVHYAYEVVSLSRNTANKLGIEFDESKQFVHMSGRRGWFVNADILLDALYKKAYEETKKRNPKASKEFLQNVAEAIAVSTFRYEMLKVSPEKIIVFDIDDATKLEGDTAPYIQYAYT